MADSDWPITFIASLRPAAILDYHTHVNYDGKLLQERFTDHWSNDQITLSTSPIGLSMKCFPRSTGEASVIEQNNTCSLPYNHLHSSYLVELQSAKYAPGNVRAQIKFGVDKATDNKSLATHLRPSLSQTGLHIRA